MLDEVDLECDEECAQVFVWAAGSEVQLKRELFRLVPRGGLNSKSSARRELDSV